MQTLYVILTQRFLAWRCLRLVLGAKMWRAVWRGGTANSAWQVWRNGRCLWAKQAQRKWGSVWRGTSLSLSLSLSRCSHFWHAFAFNLKKLFAHSNFKAKIQIFHSKFNSFYNFISNFKPYTRLFHIFTPSFRSVQTDKKFFTRRTLCLNRNF